jgi:cytochrome c553
MKNLTLAVTLACSFTLAGYAADATTSWADQCAKCHGTEGKGDTKMGKKLNLKDYSDAKVQEGFTDEQAFKALKEGIKDKGGATRMKPAEGLTDAEITGLVAYVRSLKK